MASNIRTIAGPLGAAASFSSSTGANTATVQQGSWRGQTIALAAAGTAKALAAQHQLETQALPLVQSRSLASRRVAVEPQFRRSMPADILQRAQTLGVDARRVRSGARDALAGQAPGASAGRRASATQRYLSLQLAAAALEDDVNEQAATAMLTPVRSHAHTTPQDLSELLRHAANDGEEFERFVEDILAGLDITPDDAEELADELRRARNDDAKLMQLLRKAQELPDLHRTQDREARLQLREKIQNEIREFESSSEGRQILASFNAAPAAAATADPGSFLKTYTELVSVQQSFTASLKLLLSRYPVSEIDAILDNLKKALGDDLQAATPSQDARRLGAILADLGHMAMTTTLLESVRELVELIHRRRERDRDDRRRGRGTEVEAEEDDDAGNERKVPHVRR